jgi:hypothetical protein
MKVLSRAHQDEYQVTDLILQQINSLALAEDEKFTSNRWLRESLPKRVIFQYMYGDLLTPGAKRSTILDVGGGYTALTRWFIRNHRYSLLDIMAHDPHDDLHAIENALGEKFWIYSDWHEFSPASKYDLVIANDIFPNVDQRLKIFVEQFIPHCHEMRISLTYYNVPRWYKVKRMDADEIFHMLAWDGAQLRHVLEPYLDRIESPEFDLLEQENASLFPNQRQVCLITLRGNR